MTITEQTMTYVAALAKLAISDEAKVQVAKDLDRILDYIKTMDELDTDGVEPMSHVLNVVNVFREDEVVNKEAREEVLSNAPVKQDGCFVVPKTVE